MLSSDRARSMSPQNPIPDADEKDSRIIISVILHLKESAWYYYIVRLLYFQDVISTIFVWRLSCWGFISMLMHFQFRLSIIIIKISLWGICSRSKIFSQGFFSLYRTPRWTSFCLDFRLPIDILRLFSRLGPRFKHSRLEDINHLGKHIGYLQ